MNVVCKTLRILLIEDSEDDALILIRQLCREGYSPVYERVETADQLQAALEKPGWDVIISDYVLPGFSGLDALRIMRERGTDIPCLIVSGKIGEETAVTAMKAGAKDYIMKDNLKRLGPAIEREIEEWESKQKRELAEKALREKEKLSSLLINRAPNPIIVYSASFSLRSVNSAFSQLSGFSAEEVQGLSPPFPWWPERHASKYLKDLKTDITDNTLHVEKEYRKKNGELFWVNIFASSVKSDDKSTDYILSIWTDITAEKRLRNELELLNHRIIQAQEEERKLIARELHEDTTQILAILKLELESLLSSRDIQSEKTLEKIKYLQENTEHALMDVRRYSYALRPGELDHLGLEVALEQLASDMNDSHTAQVDFKIAGKARKISTDIGLVFFRIAQEALNNAQKHSRASRIKISLSYQPDKVALVIIDNGRGFDLETISQSALDRGNLGLIGMRERAKLIGAAFNIESKIGRGTRVSVEV